MEKHAMGGKRKLISKQAMDLLVEHNWPGNVRELANALERAILVSVDRGEIMTDDLPHNLMHAMPVVSENGKQRLNQNTLRLDSIEKEHIERVLKFADGNKSKAARLLGISRKKLYQKIE
jgi:two-component system NtrC family response regulator